MWLTGVSRYRIKLSELVAELELYGFVEVERKGRGRDRGVDFYISLTGSVERKGVVGCAEGFGGMTIYLCLKLQPYFLLPSLVSGRQLL